MPRYVTLKPVTWVKLDKPLQGGIHRRPIFGDCVGIYEITNKDILNNALKNAWNGYFCFEIEKIEFETLLAFGIPLLNPKEKPPCSKPG